MSARNLLIAAFCLAAAASAEAAPHSLDDSWDGIHSFTVFDLPGINSVASPTRYDFTWSAHSSDWLNALRTFNPEFTEGQYAESIYSDSSLAWWQANHPDWILYDCDRVTPANGYSYPAVMLDFTNPEVVDWQIGNMGAVGSRPNMAVAWDNFGLDSAYKTKPDGSVAHICGVYDKNGNWVQKWPDRHADWDYRSIHNPEFTRDRIAHAKAVKDRLHAMTPYPVLLLPNGGHGKDLSQDPVLRAQFIDAVDGVLDESSTLTPVVEEGLWLANLQFIQELQASGKAYYSINMPSGSVSTMTRQVVQYTLGSYLLAKGHSAAVLILPADDNYATPVIEYPEVNAPVGTPCAPMVQNQSVWLREHTGGMSLVNPNSTNSFTVPLPSQWTYNDLYGNAVASPVTLGPRSGLVLLKMGGTGCSGGSVPSFDFSLTNSGNVSVPQGSSVQITQTATLLSGTAQAVAFSVSGLPAGVSPSFSPTSCSPASSCSTTLTLSATASAAVGTSPLTVSAQGGGLTRTSSFNLTVTAPSTGNTRLPQSSLSIQSTTSNTNPRDAIDSDSTTKWGTSPDALPVTVIYNLGGQHYVIGVRTEEQWTPIGDYDISVSADGINWGTPLTSGPPDLLNNSDFLFAAGKAGTYLKLVVKSGANGFSYAYLTDLWVLINDALLAPAFSRCDINQDHSTTVADIQLCVIQAINVVACTTGDINQDNACNVVDVQRVVISALGGQCVSP